VWSLQKALSRDVAGGERNPRSAWRAHRFGSRFSMSAAAMTHIERCMVVPLVAAQPACEAVRFAVFFSLIAKLTSLLCMLLLLQAGLHVCQQCEHAQKAAMATAGSRGFKVRACTWYHVVATTILAHISYAPKSLKVRACFAAFSRSACTSMTLPFPRQDTYCWCAAVNLVLSGDLLLPQPPQLRADKVGARGRQRPEAAAAVAAVARAAGGRRKGKDHGSEVGVPPCCACSRACVCQHLLDLQSLVEHAQLCWSGHAAVAGTACVFARLPTLTYCGNVCSSELAPDRHAA
jgi:hypothetical protein